MLVNHAITGPVFSGPRKNCANRASAQEAQHQLIEAARIELDARTAPLPGELRICQVITRVPAATWALLKHQRLLTLVPYRVVRHLVASGELAVLRTREPMPFKPLGLLLPQRDASAAALKMAEFLAQYEAKASKRKAKDASH